MSKTLFWYIFRDLVKIFLMTSAVIAGIISFGGLLKPLSEYGLSGTQVTQMLGYLMPAAQTYSLPIAALFATTVVYGRLSADNELTACRASGISHVSLFLPAVVLGLILALVSLVLLSYIVPRFTLRAERVAFDSLAEMVKKNIDRNHQIKVESYAIFAESATIVPNPEGRTDEEVVILQAPMFCLYEEDEKLRYKVPTEFFMAERAEVKIRQTENQVEFTARLINGSAFPRNFAGGSTGGVGAAQIGPFPLGSPIRENTKFMDIRQLKALHEDPTRSTEVKRLYTIITRQEQEAAFLNALYEALKRDGQFAFESEAETYRLDLSSDARSSLKIGRARLAASSGAAPALRGIQLIRDRAGDESETDEARAVTVKVQADPASDRLQIEFALEDVLIGSDAVRPGKKSIPRYLSIPIPADVAAIEARGAEYYRDRDKARGEEGKKLWRRLFRLRNNIEAEIHGRMSFAMSCLILVVMGCGLGMMFRTGNYLTAFSISVIPALITTALMVTGQHAAEHDMPNSLALGLSLVWLGNVIVLGLALGLLIHLRRQ